MKIADFLAERAALEQQYAKMISEWIARHNISPELIGSLGPAWHRALDTTKSLVEYRKQVATSISQQLEQPLRNEDTTNPNWLYLKTMHRNLADDVQTIASKQDKLQKLQKKGSKIGASKVGEAHQEYVSAMAKWDNDAPQTLSKLEKLDEQLTNLIKDSIVKFETFEVDIAAKVTSSAEKIINDFLIVDSRHNAAELSPKVVSSSFRNYDTSSQVSTPVSHRNSILRTENDAMSTHSQSSISRSKLKSRVGTIFRSKKGKKVIPVQLQSPIPRSPLQQESPIPLSAQVTNETERRIETTEEVKDNDVPATTENDSTVFDSQNITAESLQKTNSVNEDRDSKSDQNPFRKLNDNPEYES